MYRDISIFFRHLIELIQGKNRSVLADVFFADVAPAANPDPAFHPHFK
jgi:hypothetical protein